MSGLSVRPFQRDDAPALATILNEIIAIGGMTAIPEPMTGDELCDRYTDCAGTLCCHTALLDGVPVGFQVVNRHPDLPTDWGDIASFTRRAPPARGAGRALFAATVPAARDLGLTAIHAIIREGNAPGLGYYTAMGFQDIEQTVPGRVRKLFRL